MHVAEIKVHNFIKALRTIRITDSLRIDRSTISKLFLGSAISIFSIGTTWNKICETRFDPESQLFALLTACGKYLVPDDLKPLIMDVVETHPGLEFLRSAPEFHSRYVTTLGKVGNTLSSCNQLVDIWLKTEIIIIPLVIRNLILKNIICSMCVHFWEPKCLYFQLEIPLIHYII